MACPNFSMFAILNLPLSGYGLLSSTIISNKGSSKKGLQVKKYS